MDLRVHFSPCPKEEQRWESQQRDKQSGQSVSLVNPETTIGGDEKPMKTGVLVGVKAPLKSYTFSRKQSFETARRMKD